MLERLLMLSSAAQSTNSTYFTTSCQRLQSNLLSINLLICFCHLEELLQNTITSTFASELNIVTLIQCSLHQQYSRRKNGFITHTAQNVQHFVDMAAVLYTRGALNLYPKPLYDNFPRPRLGDNQFNLIC